MADPAQLFHSVPWRPLGSAWVADLVGTPVGICEIDPTRYGGQTWRAWWGGFSVQYHYGTEDECLAWLRDKARATAAEWARIVGEATG